MTNFSNRAPSFLARSAALATFLATLLVLACTATAPAITPPATTYTVNTTTDSVDAGATCATPPSSSSPCSLRDAITLANSNPAGPVAIVVPAGTYTLASANGELDYTGSDALTITGAGASSTVIAGPASATDRLLMLDPSTTTAVTIQAVSMEGGDAAAGTSESCVDDFGTGDGGAILDCAADLTLSDVNVSANTAAVSGGGVSTLGFIDYYGPPADFFAPELTLSVTDSTIAGNTINGTGEGEGGGLYLYGTLTMTNVTVADNAADASGANEGGGLVAYGGIGTLDNVTVTGNSIGPPTATGAGLSGDSLDSFGFSPEDLTLDATNTIIAGNVDGTTTSTSSENDCALLSSTTTTDHDLFGDATCEPMGGTDTGSQENVSSPGLGPLENNGGDTDTVDLLTGSPAIDMGDSSSAACPATDQRGVTRPQGLACDIGAVEYAPPTATTTAATSVTSAGASLNGTATNPVPATGTATFQYGTTTAYGSAVAANAVPASGSGAPITAAVGGLSPSTVYHYRLVVQNADGISQGADQTFTTPAATTTTTATTTTVTTPPAPTPTPTPAPTPTPTPKPTPKAAGIACTSKRSFAVHLFDVASHPRVTLDEHPLKVHGRRGHYTVRVNLVRKPKFTFTLRYEGRNARGRLVHATRRYHTCVPGPG